MSQQNTTDFSQPGDEPTPVLTKNAAASSQPEDEPTPVLKTKTGAKLRIGTYCEGPSASFSEGVKSLMKETCDLEKIFVLRTVSDGNKDYLDRHKTKFPDEAKTLNATDARSFDNIDIACVIAPYYYNLDATRYLCNQIAAAISDSHTNYLLVGCREGFSEPQYGSSKMYGDLLTTFKWIGCFFPEDDRSLVEGYTHMFTGRFPVYDTFSPRNGQQPFMYLVVLDTTQKFTRAMPKEISPAPFLYALIIIMENEISPV